MRMRPLIEICCGSAEDCAEAERGGADRAELNSALFLGGLTPSVGALKTAKRLCRIPIMVMLRPRQGGFCYTDAEYETMLIDAAAMLEAGADGLVFGCLRADASVDAERTARLSAIAHAAGKTAVFHRAIDVTPDWRAALDALIGIGIDRVLTSGQMPSAPLGLDVIAEMAEYSAGQIEILPGAGINAKNINSVLRATGCTQAHMSAKRVFRDESCAGNPSIHFGGALYLPETEYDAADASAVERIIARLDRADGE